MLSPAQETAAWQAAVSARNQTLKSQLNLAMNAVASSLINFALQTGDPAIGTIDRVNTIFTFADAPGILYKNGQLLQPNGDYTVQAGNQVTLVFPLYPGDQLLSF